MGRRFSKAAYEEAFVRDGSLRDIYILSTSLNDWHEFLRFVKSSRYPHAFCIDGEPAALPQDAAVALSLRSDAGPFWR